MNPCELVRTLYWENIPLFNLKWDLNKWVKNVSWDCLISCGSLNNCHIVFRIIQLSDLVNREVIFLWEGEVYTVWIWKWKRIVPELVRHKEKRQGKCRHGHCSLCDSNTSYPMAQGLTKNVPPSIRRIWGQGRLQFIAHSEIKISPN